MGLPPVASSCNVLDMPAPAPSANPFRNRRLCHQAETGMMLIVRCSNCGRVARYWAVDLVRVCGPDHQAHHVPFPCSKCRTKEWIDWRWTLPSAAEFAEGLIVRRPVQKVKR